MPGRSQAAPSDAPVGRQHRPTPVRAPRRKLRASALDRADRAPALPFSNLPRRCSPARVSGCTPRASAVPSTAGRWRFTCCRALTAPRTIVEPRPSAVTRTHPGNARHVHAATLSPCPMSPALVAPIPSSITTAWRCRFTRGRRSLAVTTLMPVLERCFQAAVTHARGSVCTSTPASSQAPHKANLATTAALTSPSTVSLPPLGGTSPLAKSKPLAGRSPLAAGRIMLLLALDSQSKPQLATDVSDKPLH